MHWTLWSDVSQSSSDIIVHGTMYTSTKRSHKSFAHLFCNRNNSECELMGLNSQIMASKRIERCGSAERSIRHTPFSDSVLMLSIAHMSVSVCVSWNSSETTSRRIHSLRYALMPLSFTRWTYSVHTPIGCRLVNNAGQVIYWTIEIVRHKYFEINSRFPCI